MRQQRMGQRLGIEDRLAGAVRAARHHRVRGIAEQRDAAAAPPRQRLLVDHGKFEDEVGSAEHGRYVEPIEMPVVKNVDEVVELAGAIPVSSLIVRGRDLGNPVDELAAFAVDVVADRVDHHLARREPAGADVARASAIRLPARDAAPHVDAGIHRLTFIGMELLANDGMKAIAGNHDLAFLRRALLAGIGIGEEGPGAGAILVKAGAFPAGEQPVGSDTLLERLEQDDLEIAAMNLKLWPIVAGQTPGRLAVHKLAEPVEECRFPSGDGDPRQRLLQAQLGQHLHRMREQTDADANRLDLGRRFVDARGDARFMKCQGECQPADAAADDNHVHRSLQP